MNIFSDRAATEDTFIVTVQETRWDMFRAEIQGEGPALNVGENPIQIRVFYVRTDEPAPVDAVDFNLSMDMPGMQMAVDARLRPAKERAHVFVGTI